MGMVINNTFFCSVPYNELLTNLACSSCTGEYWPLVAFVPTSLQLFFTATEPWSNNPQYSLAPG